MSKSKNKYIFFISIIILLFSFNSENLYSQINLYSNPERISKYNKFGMYPENRYLKKILLTDDKWQVRIAGSDEWQKIYIPSAYDVKDENQKVYFRTNFYLKKGATAPDRHYKLVFYGVNYSCNVKINGHFVENHSSGYNSFEIDINNNLLKFNDKNELLIEVNNKLSPGMTIPMKLLSNGWKNYGGIFRDVYILVSSQIAISKTSIEYSFNNNNSLINKSYSTCNINIAAKISDNGYLSLEDGAVDSVSLSTDIYSYIVIRDKKSDKIIFKSKNKQVSLQRYGEKDISFEFELKNPKLWSPDFPNLYKCSVILAKNSNENLSYVSEAHEFHQFDFTFGIRDLVISEGNLFLNGSEFHLKGLTRVEDANAMGNAITYSKMEKDIKTIKNLGVNVLHSLHYAPHTYILDLCAKYGLFVLEDIPIFHPPTNYLYDNNFINLSKQNLGFIIERDLNHVSLLAVGVGSGYNGKNLEVIDFIKGLSDYVKEVNSNILTFVSLKFTNFKEFYRITDFVLINFPAIDLKLDEKLAFEDTRFSNSLDFINQMSKKSVVFINQIGKIVFPGNEKGFADPFSEPSQAKHIEDNVSLVNNYSSINGVIIDTYQDYLSNTPLLTSSPDFFRYRKNNGIIDYNGKKRISFRTVEAIYKNKKVPTLSRGSFVRNSQNMFFYLGIFLTVIVILVFKREHYLRINIVRLIKNSNAFYIDIRDRRNTQLWQPIFLGILSSLGFSSIISAFFYFLKESEKFDYFLSIFVTNNYFKELLISGAWMPIKLVFVFSIFFIVTQLLISIYVKLISFLFNVRYSFSTAVSMVSWSTSIFLIYLPISIIFLRIITTGTILVIIFVSIVLGIWFLLKVNELMAVSYKVSFGRILSLNLIVFFVVMFLYFYYFDFDMDTVNYLNYFYHVIL